MPPALDVPPEVGRKVDALGSAGHRWLADLPATVDDLAREWDLTVHDVLTGGSAALVVSATMHDGRPAVLKLAMPDGLEGNGEVDREFAAVRAGQGHGYVELRRADLDRRVLLLERLGRAIVELDLTVDDRIDRIGETVARSWTAPLPAEIVRTGADQADFLDRFIADRWQRLGEPCSEQVIRAARRCALARRDAFEPDRAVLVHGDAHDTNVLEDPAAPGRYKLIDPDAMRSEPAHDLGIVIRDEHAALLRASTPADTVRAWCDRLAGLGDIDPSAIWDWALAERVSSGLFLLELGDDVGHDFLAVAAALLDG